MAQPRKLTLEQEQGVVELIKDGVKKADIARLYGVSQSTIQSIRKRNGIPAMEYGKSILDTAWAADFSERWNKTIPKVKEWLRVKGVRH